MKNLFDTIGYDAAADGLYNAMPQGGGRAHLQPDVRPDAAAHLRRRAALQVLITRRAGSYPRAAQARPHLTVEPTPIASAFPPGNSDNCRAPKARLSFLRCP